MKLNIKRLWTADGYTYNKSVTIENGFITSITDTDADSCTIETAVPGFIDQHLHGGFGANIMHSDADAILNWLEFLLKGGVTQILAGVYTAPVESLRRAMGVMREVMQRQANGAGGARLSGIHLEGPFISHNALGAMDEESILEPTIDNYNAVASGFEDIIRLVTIAPEVPGADRLIAYLRNKGIAVEAGHTAATDAEGRKAFADGIQGITHFFNASTPIKHRAPGILTEALITDDIYTECICDFVHVHESAVKLIYRCKGSSKMIVVSDAVVTTGLPDGVYHFEGSTSVVKNGESHTLSGSLDGGGMVMAQEARNLLKAGIPGWDVYRMTSLTPAEFLNIPGGRIEEGCRAEICCLDKDHRPVRVICGTIDMAGNAI